MLIFIKNKAPVAPVAWVDPKSLRVHLQGSKHTMIRVAGGAACAMPVSQLNGCH